MFGGAWNNITKSAEAVVSQWAVKRFFKFLLKKKLGQFILGDIDSDQLDVQLSNGTVQLSDLALNVDYLNSKYGSAASIVLKEGSIGSLLVKMPWKGNGFEVEIDELELVLALCSENDLSTGNCNLNEDNGHFVRNDLGKVGNDIGDFSGRSMPGDVHEGVKTIAKMVKWFLTSFHIKIKKLIVALDPYLEKSETKMSPRSHRTLVLRISETECGTCLSEDGDKKSEAKTRSFLGINQLTNFVKFQGAMLELLNVGDIDDQSCSSCTSGTSFGELFTTCNPSNATTPILIGKRGGFSGNLKLSIPCKDGSLDICKVDADVFIDPVELRLQSSTISWFLLLWETYKDFAERGNMLLSSQVHSSMPASTAIYTEKVVPFSGCFSSNDSFLNKQGMVTESIVPGSHLIPDWVPFSAMVSTEGGDFGSSVDQFFECFDGMRSFQTALGSSGVWNWTCSVFSAITAASSLASGSLHLPSEQQHVQTNVKATFAGISIIISFHDEDQNHLNDGNGDRIHVDSNVHYLGAECSDIIVFMQVCPQQTRVQGTINHIEVSDYLCRQNEMRSCDHNESHTLLIRNIQAEVQRSLPMCSTYTEDTVSDGLGGLFADYLPFRKKGDVTKITIFRTFSATHFQFTVTQSSSQSNISGTTSFSLKLPPLIFWLDFCLINMLLNLSKEVEKSTEMNHHNNELSRSACIDEHGATYRHVKRGSGSRVRTPSSTKTVQGDIIISDARIIMCFPCKSDGEDGGCTSWDQFIAVDISSPTTTPLFGGSLGKRVSSAARRSLHLNIANLNIYLVTPSCPNDAGIDSCDMQPCKFSGQNTLSVYNWTGCFSAITMSWQDGLITGPWVLEKAKHLATQEETRKFMGNDYEFATLTSLRNLEDVYSQMQQEIILSSSFLVHIHLFPVNINLDVSQYSGLHCLLNQMITELSRMSGAIDANKEPLISQTSVLLECETLEISIRTDAVENVKRLQSELPGSWSHLNLKVQNFVLLSVTNIGGISGADFRWIAHGEGTLSGSVTEVPDQEFLLISCSNSAMKRGDGGGCNVLSSRSAGSDILYVRDPVCFRDFTSISVRCSTIVAVGGRLDWLESINSFFIPPSHEMNPVVDNGVRESDLEDPHSASFVVTLVDVALSYEPFFKHSTVWSEAPVSESGSSSEKGGGVEPNVACLLAASSLSLSNRNASGSTGNEYIIRVQDLGLLLSAVAEHEKLSGLYSVQDLCDIGYVKVAREALLEVILKTNCENGLQWELGCSKSQIYVETCHDTTNGLIRLAAQLQKLFAPDIEESLVHLQNRWDSVQQAQQRNGFEDKSVISNSGSASSSSQTYTSGVDIENNRVVAGLLNEICEDAFHLNGRQAWQFESSFTEFHASPEENVEEACSLSFDNAEFFPSAVSVNGADLESSQASFLQEDFIPEIIESYCVSNLRSLSELSTGGKLSAEILKSRSLSTGNADFGRGNTGWYGDSSLRIVEKYVSEAREEASANQIRDSKLSSSGHSMSDAIEKVVGSVLLKNINVRWRMYAGLDWLKSGICDHSAHVHGRDRTVCLELTFSGIDFQYNVFPAGEVSVSKLSLSVQDIYLYDISRAAPWKLVLGSYNSKDHPREFSSKALKLDLEAVRPDPLTPLEEYRLRIAFLPILLHLHQSQLEFLISFFGEKSLSTEQSPGLTSEPNLLVRSNSVVSHSITEEALLPYFQKFDIWPIRVRVDYSPHHVNVGALKGGRYAELINLVPWKGIELELKHVDAVGVYGFSGVCETIIREWLVDISQNQIHKVLRGLPTIRSFVAVASGTAKLVSLPLESYKKDQRILKGIQRGTSAFLKSISLEAVGLGLHLAAGVHDILLQAEYLLRSIPPPVALHLDSRMETNVRYNQPKDAQQGIQQAYESISDGFEKSASALVQKPLQKYQRGASAGSALATAVRAVPTASIVPASACARSIHYALLGLRNSLDPERKKESMEKYLGPTQMQDEN